MQGRINTGFVVAFYAILGVIAWILAGLVGDLNLLEWHNANGTELYVDAGIGAVVGILVVWASHILDRKAEWARDLGRRFGKILGSLSVTEAFIFAAASAVGEELLFRGFLQQALTEVVFSGAWAEWAGLVVASLAFGMLHIGPDLEKMWPWTVMAIVLGAGFGWMYLYTGNILAPILAHFTINFFNLQSIGQKYGHLKDEPEQE
ncbi:MAG: CPBP family intramembrane glutamic endopeptidase [Persicimonas sp.]